MSAVTRLPSVSAARRTWLGFLLCCWAGIFGFRAVVIERFGGNVPWVDEWQATGQEILLPWTNGTLTWNAMFEAHNGDHRIVATRLWEIFWFVVNGAWDPMLVMVAKAAIFATAATILIHVLVHALPRWRYAAAAILATLFAFPFSYHNLLWAFQSQFDFFLLVVALGWLALSRERVVIALAAAAAALLTLGAGPILAASYVPFAIGAWYERRWPGRKAAWFAIAAIAIVGVGVSLRGERAAALRSRVDQAKALATVAAWPHSNLISIVDRLPESSRLIPRPLLNFPSAGNSWLLRGAEWLHAHPGVLPLINVGFALVALAPTIALAVLVLRRRAPGVWVWGPLGVAGFGFLMMVATAIARANEEGVAVRFLDLIALSTFAAIACAFVLVCLDRRWRVLVLTWALVTVPAGVATMVGTAGVIKQRRAQLWVTNVRQYFPSHDHQIFHDMLAADPYWPLPFLNDDIERLMAMLDDRELAPILPKSITAPEEPPRPIARMMMAVARRGHWLVLVAIGTGAWIALRERRPRESRRLGQIIAPTPASG